MDVIARELAEFLVQRLNAAPASSRILIGLAGIPASGKSTLAKLVVDSTNDLLESEADRAVLVGLDGWHLTRLQLDGFPDPKLAHDRRGTHWTFDAASYLAFVQSLRDHPIMTAVVEAPSFDHALKDPIRSAVHIRPFHRIVLIEGLYTLLSVEVWKDAALLLDERWLLRVDQEIAKNRLVKRHVETGVAADVEQAIWRFEQNDSENGQFVIQNMLQPTRIIQSVDILRTSDQ